MLQILLLLLQMIMKMQQTPRFPFGAGGGYNRAFGGGLSAGSGSSSSPRFPNSLFPSFSNSPTLPLAPQRLDSPFRNTGDLTLDRLVAPGTPVAPNDYNSTDFLTGLSQFTSPFGRQVGPNTTLEEARNATLAVQSYLPSNINKQLNLGLLLTQLNARDPQPLDQPEYAQALFDLTGNIDPQTQALFRIPGF
jgi:hypothetical protein